MQDGNTDGYGQRLLAAGWLWAVLLAPLLLWACWDAPFLNYDDKQHIVENEALAPEASWGDLWMPDIEKAYYYPVTNSVFRLARTTIAHALAPVADHPWAASIRVLNLLLHVGAGLLLWRLLRMLGAGRALAGFVACAFVLHPTACESVCWAVELKNTLSAFLALAALTLYAGARTGWKRAGAALLYLAALFAKHLALGLLPVVVLWEFLGRPQLIWREDAGPDAPAPAGRWRDRVWRVLPWCLAAAGNVYVGTQVAAHQILGFPGGTLGTALLTDVVILGRYVVNFFYPAWLSAYYYVKPVTTFSDPRLWLYGILLVVLVTGTVWLTRRDERHVAVFAWLWFVGAQGQTLNLVPLNDLMHDRFVYLAAPGFWLAVGLGLRGLVGRAPVLQSTARKYAGPAVLLLALVWSLWSGTRSPLWSDTLPLFRNASQMQPQSSYARLFHAKALDQQATRLRQRGEDAGATALQTAALLELEAGLAAPDFDRYLHPAEDHLRLAAFYAQRGRYDDALAQIHRALHGREGRRIKGVTLSLAKRLQGMIFLTQNRPEAALRAFQTALRYGPDMTDLRVLEAQAWLRLRDRALRDGNAERARACRAYAVKRLRSLKPGQPGYEQALPLLHRLEQAPMLPFAAPHVEF